MALSLTLLSASEIGYLVVVGAASLSTSVFTAKKWVSSSFITTLITNGGCTSKLIFYYHM